MDPSEYPSERAAGQIIRAILIFPIFTDGAINPTIAVPAALGVLLGATIGACTLARLSNTTIRKLFLPLLGLLPSRR